MIHPCTVVEVTPPSFYPYTYGVAIWLGAYVKGSGRTRPRVAARLDVVTRGAMPECNIQFPRLEPRTYAFTTVSPPLPAGVRKLAMKAPLRAALRLRNRH